MPLHDWQFYIVTLLVTACLWRMTRSTLAIGGSQNAGKCTHCPSSGSEKKRTRQTRVTLTIDHRRI
jgi:hypothetical protein